jgi:Domain of unknown function (DUF4157)
MHSRFPRARERAHQRVAEAPGARTSAGQPLTESTRQRFEPRFRHDFADVRIHADAAAGVLADAVGAPAFATGNEIFLRPGEFELEDAAGQYLLAHELAHVVQHDRTGTDPHLTTSRAGDASEGEATSAAARVLSGGEAGPMHAPAAAVAPFSLDPKALWNSITDNSLSGAVGMATEMSKTAASPIARGLGMVDEYGREVSKVAGESSGLPMLGRALGPLGIISNVMSMQSALKTGGAQGAGDFLAAGNGVVGSLAPTLELGAMGAEGLGFGGAAAGMEGLAASLGPIGAVAGSFAGGYTLGTHLNNNTSVGDRAQDSLGWIDGMLTGDGEQSWMLRQSEEFDDAWDKGDALGVIGNGLQIGGAATAGAIGGLAGGAVDAAKWVGGGISDLFD